MNPPINIDSSAVARNADADCELLDHRNQAQSLPRSARSGSHTSAIQSPLFQHGSRGSNAASGFGNAGNALQAGRRPSMSIDDGFDGHNNTANEFAIEDDLQFGGLEDNIELGGSSNATRNVTTRPRAGSHLDTVLSQPVRISPLVTYSSRGRPPSLSLDVEKTAKDARTRESSSSSSRSDGRRAQLFSPRARRMSGKNNEKEDVDRVSIDAPSHPHSQDGEEEEAEQDVCFPMSEEVRSAEGVDFDELDAHVVEESIVQRTGSRAIRKMSTVSIKPDIRLSFNEKEDGTTLGSSASHSASKESDNESSRRDYSSRFASPAMEAMKMQHMHVPDITSAARTTGPGPLLGKAISQPRPLTSTHLRQMERNQDAPDRFSFFTSERDDTLHAPNLGGLLSDPSDSFKKLFRQDRGCWWLDVMCPTDAEMKTIAKAFGIHPLTAEDIRVQETREKVELFKSYYFVCFRSFDHDKTSEDFLEPVNIYIVVFKEGLISFHFAPTSHPANVRRRIRQLRDYVSVSADWISYAIIDDVTDVFMPLIHEIEYETDAIEDAVLITRENDTGDMLRRIGSCRKKVMALFRLLHGKADVIKMFAKRCNEHWDVAPKGEIGLYLGDIQDHLVTMTSSLSQFEKILSRSHSNYLAQLSIHSMESSNRMTEVLGKITIIATLLVPMNLVTGLFGMNVPVLGGVTPGKLWWFFGIIVFIVAFCVGAFIVSKRYMRRTLLTRDKPE